MLTTLNPFKLLHFTPQNPFEMHHFYTSLWTHPWCQTPVQHPSAIFAILKPPLLDVEGTLEQLANNHNLSSWVDNKQDARKPPGSRVVEAKRHPIDQIPGPKFRNQWNGINIIGFVLLDVIGLCTPWVFHANRSANFGTESEASCWKWRGPDFQMTTDWWIYGVGIAMGLDALSPLPVPAVLEAIKKTTTLGSNNYGS